MNPNNQLFLKTSISVVAIVALLVAATSTQQYSFYIFLRWLIMGISLYFGLEAYKKNKSGLMIFYSITIIIFNPLKKLWFQKETWHTIDFNVAMSFAVNVIYDWAQYLQKSKL